MSEPASLVTACELLVAASDAQAAQQQLLQAGLLAGDDGLLATIQSGDLVSVARDVLYRLLVQDGWVPPQRTATRMAVDALLSDEGTGASDG